MSSHKLTYNNLFTVQQYKTHPQKQVAGATVPDQEISTHIKHIIPYMIECSKHQKTMTVLYFFHTTNKTELVVIV